MGGDEDVGKSRPWRGGEQRTGEYGRGELGLQALNLFAATGLDTQLRVSSA